MIRQRSAAAKTHEASGVFSIILNRVSHDTILRRPPHPASNPSPWSMSTLEMDCCVLEKMCLISIVEGMWLAYVKDVKRAYVYGLV